MAWAVQAWRHAFHGLPDPSQATTEQQFRLSFMRVPNASDVAPFTPLELSYAEALTFHGIPESTNLDVKRRAAIHRVPAINLSDSIDRDGLIAGSVDAVTASLLGTYDAPDLDGFLDAQVGDVSASLVGSFGYVHFFDIEYSVTPMWVKREQPARNGLITVTVGGVTASVRGSSLPPDSTQGRIQTTTDSVAAALAGTLTPPPGRDGRIATTLQNTQTALRGTFIPVGGTNGLISATLDPVSASVRGTFAKFETDGSFGGALDPVTTQLRGAFIPAGAVVGRLAVSLEGVTSSLRGSLAQPPSDGSKTFEAAAHNTYIAPQARRRDLTAEEN